MQIPPHFTNIQHGLADGAGSSWRRRTRRTGRSILITDGLPTAHFEGQMLYLLYPPDPRTEAATMREGLALPARRDHDQPVPAAELVAIGGRRAVRLPAGRIDHGPRVLHGRPRPRPLCRLGLPEPAAVDRRLAGPFWIVLMR